MELEPSSAPVLVDPSAPDPAAVAALPPPVGSAKPTRSLDWWTRPATRWVSLLFVTGIVFYLCWLMIEPFVDVVMWAVVLAVVFNPVHRRLLDKLQSPNTAAALSCLLVVVSILIPLTLMTLLLVDDAADVARYVQTNKDTLLDPNSPTAVGRAQRWVGQYVNIDWAHSREWVAARVKATSGTIASRTLNVVGGVVGVVVQIFFVIFTLFYLFRDGPALKAAARDVLPLDQWAAHDVFQRTKDVIMASVYGSLVIAAVQGALGGIMFAILGVPSAVLWGAVMILLCMVPLLGAFLVWVPAALYLAATGHWTKAIVLTLWGALVIGTIDNVLRPRLVGGRTRLHELVVFFAVIGGLQVFGVLGIITGPAIAAVAIALFQVWRRAKTPAPVAIVAADGTPVAAAVPAG